MTYTGYIRPCGPESQHYRSILRIGPGWAPNSKRIWKFSKNVGARFPEYINFIRVTFPGNPGKESLVQAPEFPNSQEPLFDRAGAASRGKVPSPVGSVGRATFEP